ncbi:MAG: tetratricopeptide repeat protein [Candidatus Melainabacteria bacterium]|nr:tetratricopeptide repeat protein [Candidatus Melainabacteria bacterium]
MRFKHRSILTILVTIGSMAFFASLAPSARAADLFKDGCDLYARKDYQRAARYFIVVIRRNKTYWPAYYQLANTYLALDEYDLAKKYYEECIERLPDFKTAKSCKQALDHIAVLQKTPGAQIDEPKEDHALVAAQKRKDEQKEEAKKQYEKELESSEKRKSDILQEAMKQAAAIRAEAQQRIQDIHDNGNYWVRNPDTGEIGVGIPKTVYEDITKDAEERAKRVIDQAEARAKGIQPPREPDWDSYKVHPSSVARKNTRHH